MRRLIVALVFASTACDSPSVDPATPLAAPSHDINIVGDASMTGGVSEHSREGLRAHLFVTPRRADSLEVRFGSCSLGLRAHQDSVLRWAFRPGSPDAEFVFLCTDVEHLAFIGPGDTLEISRFIHARISRYPIPDAALDFTVVAEVNNELREFSAPHLDMR